MIQNYSQTTTYVTIPEERFLAMEESINAIKHWLHNHERQDEGLLSVPETMKMFGCTRATLNNWKKNGTLTPRVIGGRVYYLKADCLNALKGFPTPMKGGKRNG